MISGFWPADGGTDRPTSLHQNIHILIRALLLTLAGVKTRRPTCDGFPQVAMAFICHSADVQRGSVFRAYENRATWNRIHKLGPLRSFGAQELEAGLQVRFSTEGDGACPCAGLIHPGLDVDVARVKLKFRAACVGEVGKIPIGNLELNAYPSKGAGEILRRNSIFTKLECNPSFNLVFSKQICRLRHTRFNRSLAALRAYHRWDILNYNYTSVSLHNQLSLPTYHLRFADWTMQFHFFFFLVFKSFSQRA